MMKKLHTHNINPTNKQKRKTPDENLQIDSKFDVVKSSNGQLSNFNGMFDK